MNEKNRFIILLLILENIVCSLCVNIAVIVSPSAGNLAKCAKLHERTSENTDTYGTYKCMFHNHIQKTRKNGPASRHDERSRNVRTNQQLNTSIGLKRTPGTFSLSCSSLCFVL